MSLLRCLPPAEPDAALLALFDQSDRVLVARGVSGLRRAGQRRRGVRPVSRHSRRAPGADPGAQSRITQKAKNKPLRRLNLQGVVIHWRDDEIHDLDRTLT